jgi:small subunit ribosomal protein S17
MSSAATPARGNRKSEIGVVTSDKTAKTRRVEIERLVSHPKYGKFQKRRSVAIAHDEDQISHAGDLVEIVETRPISKTKHWRVVRVIRTSAGAGTVDQVES